MKNAARYFAKSFFWGTVSKIIDAAIKVVSVPLLLNYFGKDDFGLITLAISINAYLQILDLGVNTGGTKFFSTWIAAKQYDTVNDVAQTSITFYGIIGIFNALILLLIAFWGIDLFSIDSQQQLIMKSLLIVLASIAVLNWISSVFNQLLTANEDIAFIQKIFIGKSLANLTIIWITLLLDWSILTYFIWFTVVNSFQIIPFYLKAKRDGLIAKPVPNFKWSRFLPILRYSIAIVAIGVFSMTATRMRPIILSAFSVEGVGIVTEYRIMETITLFVISIGGLLISIFLPKISKLIHQGDQKKIEHFAVKGTLYTSIISCILCFPIMINSRDLIVWYVGIEYEGLSMWLNIWMSTILLYLHNSPVSSIVLATGKTKMLVFSTAISSVISLVVNAWLCSLFGVGSAVMGYTIYIILQMSFYYLYFNKQILMLDTWKIFKSFIIPVSLGSTLYVLLEIVQFDFYNDLVGIALKSLIWTIAFLVGLIILKIVNLKSILNGEVV